MKSKHIAVFSIILMMYTLTMSQTINLSSSGSESSLQQNSEAQRLADRQTRLTYWYYLRRPEVLYSSEIKSRDKTMVIRIYRSVVGTFLTICSIPSDDKKANIETFIRLGSGAIPTNNGLSQMTPMLLSPLFIEHRLSPKEYPVIMNDDGSFIIKGLMLETTSQKKNLAETLNQIEMVDRYLRRRYWFYIGGAQLIQPQAVKTNLRTYLLLNYYHQNSTYLVISSIDSLDNISINTFVRLGKPSQTSDNEQKVVLYSLQPSILILN